MVRLRSDLLSEHHSLIGQLIRSGHKALSQGHSKSGLVEAHLELISDNLLAENRADRYSEVYSEIRRSFPRLDRTESQTNPEPSGSLESLEKLRILLVALAMGIDLDHGFKDQSELQELFGEGIEDKELIKVVERHEELTIATLGDCNIVLLPGLGSEAAGVQMIAWLDSYFETRPLVRDCLVDFSLIEKFPAALFRSLIMYQTQLRERGHELFLCWMAVDLLPPEKMKTLQVLLDLSEIGGHWFSKGRET